MDFSWFLHFDDPVTWVAIAVLLFIGIVVYLGVPKKLMAALDDRAQQIQNELDEARKLREEAQELLASYTRKQRAAEKEAEEIVALAKHEAKLYAEEMRANLKEQLARRAETANARIAQAEANATALVRDRAVEMAVKAAESAISTSVTSAAKAKLVDDSIKDAGSLL